MNKSIQSSLVDIKRTDNGHIVDTKRTLDGHAPLPTAPQGVRVQNESGSNPKQIQTDSISSPTPRRGMTGAQCLRAVKAHPEKFGTTDAHLRQVEKDITKIRERQVEDDERAARRKEQPTLQGELE